MARVFVRATVGGLRPGRWADVDDADLRLPDWLEMGLVTMTDYLGESAPIVLPSLPCCGQI